MFFTLKGFGGTKL